MKAIFFGTPAIAVPALDALCAVAEVTLVICQPDRPKGRGLALAAPPVKERALELGIAVHQPTKVRTVEFAELIRDQAADVAVVMAYGRILTKAVLDAPRLGCVNLHASLLPLYRGAAPITWAIVDGQTETGVSLMQMDEGMDTGAVLSMKKIPIPEGANLEELSAALAACAANVVSEDLPKFLRGELLPTPQDHERATHARLLTKEDGRINFDQPCKAVHNHVRGMNPWPGATTSLNDKTLKVIRTYAVPDAPADAPPGTVVVAEKGRIEVTCSAGRIEIAIAQLEGKKALPAAELLSGRAITLGQRLGKS
jgi:methionyl-tRNA formyltransferase